MSEVRHDRQLKDGTTRASDATFTAGIGACHTGAEVDTAADPLDGFADADGTGREHRRT